MYVNESGQIYRIPNSNFQKRGTTNNFANFTDNFISLS